MVCFYIPHALYFHCIIIIIIIIIIFTAIEFHSVAVVFTLVQTKQIRIHIHKRDNTIQNTINTSTHYQNTHTLQSPHIHTPTHYKTHTYTHPHITKKFKTTTVQDTRQSNSHNTICTLNINFTSI